MLKKITTILFFFFLFSTVNNSQECSDYYNYYKFVNCKKCINKNYKLYMQPKNITIWVNDTLTYTVTFYEDRDYLISFCADKKYYPINIRLLESETGKELYDNANDGYCESTGVGFYNACNLIIEVNFLAEKLDKDKLKNNEKVCAGMILQWKKVVYNKNKLYVSDNKSDKLLSANKGL